MDAHTHEWLSLLIRWLHITAGIAWIGASFYFNWLENSLERRGKIRSDLAGNLWAIHGGGFYYLEKFKVAPPTLPQTLHWFKWEAYFTWMSGMALLIVVYYLNSKTFLIPADSDDLSPPLAIAVGLGSLLLAWVIYDVLCRSKLGSHNKAMAGLGVLLMAGASYILCDTFNPRAGYIHIGAMIGTIMVANVFFVIIPSQKSLVAAAKNNQNPDANLGNKALQRSRHNNYLTLPVLFIMVSNHYPSTFSHKYNWLILTGLTVGGGLIRHFFNIRKKPTHKGYLLPLAAVVLAGSYYLSKPKAEKNSTDRVSFTRVSAIVADRCLSCHSHTPTDPDYPAAPNGVTYDTPREIQVKVDLINIMAVQTEAMPLGNKTKMTRAERDLLGAWIKQGAKID